MFKTECCQPNRWSRFQTQNHPQRGLLSVLHVILEVIYTLGKVLGRDYPTGACLQHFPYTKRCEEEVGRAWDEADLCDAGIACLIFACIFNDTSDSAI